MAWPLPEKKRPGGGQPSNGFENEKVQRLEEQFEEESFKYSTHLHFR